MTKEVLILRVTENRLGVDPFLLLALLSLKVVQEQYAAFTLMQTNREHLGDRWKEVKIPLPSTEKSRNKVAGPVRDYFEAIVKARVSYDALLNVFESDVFGTRP